MPCGQLEEGHSRQGAQQVPRPCGRSECADPVHRGPLLLSLGQFCCGQGLPCVAWHPFFRRSPYVNFYLKSTLSVLVQNFEKSQAK